MTLRGLVSALKVALWPLWRFRSLPRSEALSRVNAKINVSLCIALSLWSEYCGVDVDEIKRLRSYELVKLCLVWIRRLDALIDTPAGRRAYVSAPASVKANPVLQEVISEVVRWIICSDLPREKQRMLLSYLARLRHHVLFGPLREMLSAQLSGNQNLKELGPRIEQTSGMMYRSFAGILNRIHDVPAEIGDRVEQLFCTWMVAVQVADDLLDFPLDYHNDDVSFVTAALRSNPAEELHLHTFLSKGHKLTSQWIKRNAPESHSQVLALAQEYLARAQSIEPSSPVVQEILVSTKVALHLATDLSPVTSTLIAIMRIWNRWIAK